ncbi:hypothetical protein RhiirA1_180990 [Rhizophagus irregularis]|uniref:Uncharacterized protein n=2 Tax=Rhizophagus irregularis TaxID=588596 RepID=A0A2N0RTH5_9GLOM|nr:hypothetical protein RhiirA1_180990 [Rhizophagus irregularis]
MRNIGNLENIIKLCDYCISFLQKGKNREMIFQKKKKKRKKKKKKNYKKSFHVIQNYLQYKVKIMAEPFCRISLFSRPLQHGNNRMINFICLFCMEFRINEESFSFFTLGTHHYDD